MPKITTHLHLALLLRSKIEINDFEAFLLGNAYPDCWKTDMKQAQLNHYKKELQDDSDLTCFYEENEKNDFNDGWYFHLWIDNAIKHIDLKEITKYDCMICDMEVIQPVVMELLQKTFIGKRAEAFEHIKALEREPMPLYLVTEDKKQQYLHILDQLVEAYLNVMNFDKKEL